MNEALSLLVAWLVGGMLGAIFFGGLWWTVRKGIPAAEPALWFLGSLLIRTSIVLVGFYYVGCGNWQLLVACLVGFVVARWIVTYLTRHPRDMRLSAGLEGDHAP
jgi:F1F0 ATPase subunit 2